MKIQGLISKFKIIYKCLRTKITNYYNQTMDVLHVVSKTIYYTLEY